MEWMLYLLAGVGYGAAICDDDEPDCWEDWLLLLMFAALWPVKIGVVLYREKK